MFKVFSQPRSRRSSSIVAATLVGLAAARPATIMWGDAEQQAVDIDDQHVISPIDHYFGTLESGALEWRNPYVNPRPIVTITTTTRSTVDYPVPTSTSTTISTPAYPGPAATTTTTISTSGTPEYPLPTLSTSSRSIVAYELPTGTSTSSAVIPTETSTPPDTTTTIEATLVYPTNTGDRTSSTATIFSSTVNPWNTDTYVPSTLSTSTMQQSTWTPSTSTETTSAPSTTTTEVTWLYPSPSSSSSSSYTVPTTHTQSTMTHVAPTTNTQSTMTYVAPTPSSSTAEPTNTTSDVPTITYVGPTATTTSAHTTTTFPTVEPSSNSSSSSSTVPSTSASSSVWTYVAPTTIPIPTNTYVWPTISPHPQPPRSTVTYVLPTIAPPVFTYVWPTMSVPSWSSSSSMTMVSTRATVDPPVTTVPESSIMSTTTATASTTDLIPYPTVEAMPTSITTVHPLPVYTWDPPVPSPSSSTTMTTMETPVTTAETATFNSFTAESTVQPMPTIIRPPVYSWDVPVPLMTDSPVAPTSDFIPMPTSISHYPVHVRPFEQPAYVPSSVVPTSAHWASTNVPIVPHPAEAEFVRVTGLHSSDQAAYQNAIAAVESERGKGFKTPHQLPPVYVAPVAPQQPDTTAKPNNSFTFKTKADGMPAMPTSAHGRELYKEYETRLVAIDNWLMILRAQKPLNQNEVAKWEKQRQDLMKEAHDKINTADRQNYPSLDSADASSPAVLYAPSNSLATIGLLMASWLVM